MTERISRAFPTDDLVVRSDQRTVIGIAVPFGQVTEVFDLGRGRYSEEFVRGAFARTIAERGPEKVKFLGHHEGQSMPLGRATLLREDAAGLYAEFRVSQTRAGDEALELIRDGALDSLSIGFTPIAEDTRSKRGVVRRTEVRLNECSLVNWPAYSGAQILAVRHATATPALSIARRRLALLEAAAGTHLPKD